MKRGGPTINTKTEEGLPRWGKDSSGKKKMIHYGRTLYRGGKKKVAD